MNESPDPLQPTDNASDPLLTALRQRLGDYGEAPPPGAWVGIRQRLPAPVGAQPWWRRPRRLLPLLALLLGLVAAGLLTRRVARPVGGPATSGAAATHSAPGTTTQLGNQVSAIDNQTLNAHTDSFTASDALPPATGLKSAQPASRPNNQAVNSPGQPRRVGLTVPSAVNQPSRRLPRVATAILERSALPPAISRNALFPSAVGPERHRAPGHQLAAGPLANNRTTASRSQTNAAPASRARAMDRRAAVAGNEPLGRQRRSAGRDLAASRNEAARRPELAAAAGSRTYLLPKHQRTSVAKPGALPRDWSAAGRRRPAAVAIARATDLSLGQSIDYLQVTSFKILPASLAGLPAPLAARPDSLRPPYPPVRRWALLALAGPTLSYRTIGPAPATTTGYPDFAHLERPALGLGAQVQVRRVLSGRWALAVGVGFQEYATRLALQLGDSSTGHIRQRDTYRLLTLPVQLSYALGAPQGRLARALLLGAEAGWYQGGRSTEGSDCGCQQQAYTSTVNPYYPWSLALSLGLDLRYRVGGPASRWQWVVQPTGRYVLTPFVRPNTAGFSPRQPFSLGVLTGFSWDIR